MYTRNCEIKPGIVFPEGMQRVALGIEYQGARFNGFQKQPSAPLTIQGVLEAALSKVANESVTLVCAGRTDAGVHAAEQVVHFDTLAERPNKAWVEGVNAALPDDVRVHWAQPVPPNFHARFSALARTYRYVILPAPVKPACMHQGVTWTRYDLSLASMQEAAKYLEGEHDFSSFRSSQCQAVSPIRTMEYIRCFEHGAFIVIEVKANAFLHHMVRNIAGALMDVSRGAKTVGWLQGVLEARNRSLSSPTASPYGLYFVRAHYEEEFSLPMTSLGPLFLSSMSEP